MEKDRILSIERWLTNHDNYISGLRISNYFYTDQIADIFVSFTMKVVQMNHWQIFFGWEEQTIRVREGFSHIRGAVNK